MMDGSGCGNLEKYSRDDASKAHRLCAGAFGEALCRLSHLLLWRYADRNLAKDRSGEDRPRPDPRVRRRAAQNRSCVAARTGRVLVRYRRGFALTLPSVRAPSYRHQLRTTEPALCQIQAGTACVCDAGIMDARQIGRRVRRVASENLGTLP